MKSIPLRQWEAAAYAAGRLTQLRRVCMPQPVEFVQTSTIHKPKHPAPYLDSYCSERKTDTNPRGMSDLWCWWTTDDRPDCNFIKAPYGATGDRLALRQGARMPLWAVRFHPVITAVRLERVQEMTEADAFRCGVERVELGPFEIEGVPVHPMTDTYINSYRVQFTRDNPRTPWKDNPWTWVYELEGVKG